ncbi:hypothetical protein OAB54_07695, partial [Flavobacteriaceae bacterium]|nr:hypothetical protein [Flavobacteriaceae bacterium]
NLMFYFFLVLSALSSVMFVKSYYPDFKGSIDLFSILGFILICGIGSFFFTIIIFIPYYLFVE